MTFGAMDYMTAQTLRAGYSVIYDCNANKRSDRKSALAVELGAKFVLVRLQAPPEVALERIRTREETHDQMRMSDEDARAMLERFTRAIEEPSEKEFVIYINGEASFEEQYISFQQQVRPLIGG